MEYRKLGKSELECSVITFGAWAIGGWMWGGTDKKEALEAIRAAYNEGITSIDTAPAYGLGLSEELVAEAIKDYPRDKVQILTKFGMRWGNDQGTFGFKSKDNDGKPFDMYKWSSKESIMKECEDSLRRLKTDYIDLYQQHWPDASTPVAETMEALTILQEQGKVREIGVCNYDTDLMKEAAKTTPALVSDQVPYSMVLRDIEEELVPYCKEQQKAIIAYSPLQRGILTGKIKPGHQFGEGDTRDGNKFYTDENIEHINGFLEEIRPIAEKHNATLAQLVIRWTIDQPGITIALVGARNARQAIENAQAANIELSGEDLNSIGHALRELTIEPAEA